MKQRAQNTLSMWRAALSHLNANETLWDRIPAFRAAVDALDRQILAVEKAGTTQQRPSGGITITKDEASDIATDLILDLAGAAMAYAIEKGDADLEARTNWASGQIAYLPDNERRDRLQSIIDAITPVAPALDDYGVTGGEVEEAHRALDTFRGLISAPRNIIAGRGAATASVPVLIAEGRRILARLDGLVRRMRRTQPDFVGAYKRARITVDSGIRHEHPPAQQPGTGAQE